MRFLVKHVPTKFTATTCTESDVKGLQTATQLHFCTQSTEFDRGYVIQGACDNIAWHASEP